MPRHVYEFPPVQSLIVNRDYHSGRNGMGNVAGIFLNSAIVKLSNSVAPNWHHLLLPLERECSISGIYPTLHCASLFRHTLPILPALVRQHFREPRKQVHRPAMWADRLRESDRRDISVITRSRSDRRHGPNDHGAFVAHQVRQVGALVNPWGSRSIPCRPNPCAG